LPKARRATQGKELIAIRGRDRLAALLLLSPSEAEAAQPASRKGAKARTSRVSGTGKKKKTSKAQSGSKATKARTSRTTGASKKKKTSKAQSGSKATTSPSTGRKKRSKKR
jgi:hypothetical protein